MARGSLAERLDAEAATAARQRVYSCDRGPIHRERSMSGERLATAAETTRLANAFRRTCGRLDSNRVAGDTCRDWPLAGHRTGDSSRAEA